MTNAYADDAFVGAVTALMVADGCRVFQIYKTDEDEARHVSNLLDAIDPPHGARVLDLGCGVGGMAAYMTVERPDLNFTLLNASAAQLELCPKHCLHLHANMHHVPLADESVDVTLICYALGHGTLAVVEEAARVTKSGGIVFIYDVTSEGDATRFETTLQYRLHSLPAIVETAARCGLVVDRAEYPPVWIGRAFQRFMDPAAYDYSQVFANVNPTLIRMVKA